MSKIHKSNNVKQNLLMNSLENFFKTNNNLETIMPIIRGQSKISLRVMDWFVTNYSKKHNISFLIDKDGNIINSIKTDNAGKEFVVYLDYKLQLKGYQKKQFDPFCRRSRINFYYDDDKFFVTTVGQLNFFRWTIQNSVLEYISSHLKEIENDMNTCYKAVYNLNKTDKSSRRKRQELSLSLIHI